MTDKHACWHFEEIQNDRGRQLVFTKMAIQCIGHALHSLHTFSENACLNQISHRLISRTARLAINANGREMKLFSISCTTGPTQQRSGRSLEPVCIHLYTNEWYQRFGIFDSNLAVNYSTIGSYIPKISRHPN